jgi:hypothetical protein
MLFRLWGGANFRSTKDLDLEGFLQDEAEVVREVFASICVQPVEDDGLVFDASSVKVTEIRDTQEYGGFRVLLTAKLGTAILRLQIDVGFGDAITPMPAITEFPSILSQSRPRIRVYPRETVVAEKFEAMVQLGMTNSRMKDYYDLWFMSCRPRLPPRPSSLSASTGKFKIGGSQLDDIHSFDGTICFHFVVRK